MSSLNMDFDQQSISSTGSRQHTFERPGSDIKLAGYLKKLKTMKKKYFVLRSTSSSGPARLEYYDSEKKFKAGQLPKRSIHLHTCFNINKKSDSRHGKHGIALYTSEDCFTVLAESEKQQEAWLGVILEFQNEYLPDGDMHKEHYDNVWQVTLQPRGLGQGRGPKSQYRLCLNSSTVSLVKTSSSQPQFTIQLVTIRSVAHHENSFRLEVGNYAPTGAGEFWFTTEDSIIAKDMHETLLHYMNATVKDSGMSRDQRTRRAEVHSQPVTYCPPNSLEAHSPGSPNFHLDYPGAHRLRSDSRTSRTSKASFPEDFSPGFVQGYNGEHSMVVMREHCSVVPPDMSPPPSPNCLDDEINAYLAMDMDKTKQRSSLASVTSQSTNSSYLAMEPHGAPHKGEMSTSYSDMANTGYMSMAVHHGPSSTHPVPCHTHSYSEPVHSTHLPTVKEGGSNEGYLPMDIPTSPGSLGILKPEPAVCMLSDDLSGLPPRTYSLGSKPSQKYSSYMEMGVKKGAGNDMSRATSAPHILKGRREREHRTASPTPNTSPLSVSLKSDDSDSFMEYIPMRPRTSSDSFNYRNRTSSFGKSQQPCRPRSSSHGQGTRPVINFSKLNVDKTRPLHEASQRTSQESSLQGSFDSLRVSNESLRRLSQEMRHTSGSNASDYADMRGTPSPQMKNMKSEADHYVSMQVGTGGRRSPHRVRTDSSGSGRYPDVKTNSSDHLHHQSHQHALQHAHQQAPLQHSSDYTEMAPLNAGAGSAGDSYFNMSYNTRHGIGADSKSSPSASMVSSSHQEDPSYMNMHVPNKSNRSDGSRSLSMENVDTYIVFEPQSGNKPRTGSLGSKDKVVSKPGSARKTSSASVSSASSPSSSGIIYQQVHPFLSSSTRTGGSSDSIRKASRQSSMEKHGSLGKDFRKKSGSTGSRPSTGKNSFMMNFGKDHHVSVVGVMPSLKPSASKLPQDDPEDDEYIEFSPTATKGGSHHHHYHSNSPNSGLSHSNVSISNSGSQGSLPFTSSDSFSSTRSNLTPSPADDEPYTLYSPAVSASTKSVHFQQQGQHNQHHPSQAKLGSSPSFTSSQIQQFTPKEADEYVGFEPGVIPSSSHASSHTFSNVKQVEAKDQPQYVGFEPGARSSISTGPQSSVPKPVSPKNQEEYVGYEPGTVSMRSEKPMALSSVMSYYQGYENGMQTGANKSRQQRHSQHRTSMENTQRSNRSDSRSVTKNPRLPSSSSLTFDTQAQLDSSASVTPSQTPPVPPLSTNLFQQVHSVSKPVAQDANSDYLKFNPAESAASKVSQENSSRTPGKADSLAQGSAKQQLSQLFVNVDQVSKTSAAPAVNTDNGSTPVEENKQKLQTQQQQQLKVHQPPQSIYRQLSAPASQSSSVGKTQHRVVDTQSVQTLSPQNVSPDNPTSHRHKHLSSSSVMESPSPTGSGSRHKHWSGFSTSSQKSRKTSSDSEKSQCKGNKSDSLISSLGAKSKRRVPSGEKSPESAASLEAKIIPAEARIRHSLDDVTSVMGMVCKGGQTHGMVRPDSTPCIQNLATSVGQESRSLGDTPSSTPRSGSTQLGPRSRHSLSDLGAYQQMNFAPSGVVSSSSDSSNSPGSKGSGSNSGINESSPADQATKSLNYVKLDLGCLDSQGDADGKSSRIKSRNSSDADEKQPPLSYAEIDFVKSQSWNRALPMGVSGDSSSSKS